MRHRKQRWIEKQLRNQRWPYADVRRAVERRIKAGECLIDALRNVALLPPHDTHHVARLAGRLLSAAGDRWIVAALLRRFYELENEEDLYSHGLTLEEVDSPRTVRPLIQALLGDENPHRRRASARALGWMASAGQRGATALVTALADPLQPQPVREEAAESLSYTRTRRAIPVLTAALREPDVCIRFWSAFALGSYHHPKAIAALVTALNDPEAPPGNWWPVGREALAMLANLDPAYAVRLSEEISRIDSSPNASPEDVRWADHYRTTTPATSP